MRARGWRGSRQRRRVASAFGSGKRVERVPVALFFEEFDLEFRVLETGFTKLEQFGALLKPRHQFSQRYFAGFHGIDDGFELVEGILEGELRELFFGHSGSMWAPKTGFQSLVWRALRFGFFHGRKRRQRSAESRRWRFFVFFCEPV